MYKGAVKKGSTVEAELSCASSCRGTALLTIAYANDAGATGSRHVTVAPSGTNKTSLTTSDAAEGTLKVWVDMNDESDTGKLTVWEDGTKRASEPITGDTVWTYSVL